VGKRERERVRAEFICNQLTAKAAYACVSLILIVYSGNVLTVADPINFFSLPAKNSSVF